MLTVSFGVVPFRVPFIERGLEGWNRSDVGLDTPGWCHRGSTVRAGQWVAGFWAACQKNRTDSYKNDNQGTCHLEFSVEDG